VRNGSAEHHEEDPWLYKGGTLPTDRLPCAPFVPSLTTPLPCPFTCADCVNLGGCSDGEHRFKCRRLLASIYLRVADDLVTSEATRLGSLTAPSMRNMLHSATFHRSMLVCSALAMSAAAAAAAAACTLGAPHTGAGGARGGAGDDRPALSIDALTCALSVPAFEVCKVLNPFQKLLVPVGGGGGMSPLLL
jgi:hypothetical protein